MAKKEGLTMRQVTEAMTIFFDPEAAGDLEAVIQFNVTGQEPGNYYIQISKGECAFHLGEAPESTLTIDTPSEVWMKIVDGEISSAEAMAQGLYKAEGDVNLLLRFNELFKTEDKERFMAPPGQRPPGPLPLPGAVWFYVVLSICILFFVTFNIESINRWISVGIPYFLLLLIVVYRLACRCLAWMEGWSLVFFALAGIAVITGYTAFENWGAEIGFATFGAIFLVTVFLKTPLMVDYFKWTTNKRVWTTSLFLHPLTAMTLCLGWFFIVMGIILTLANLWQGTKTPLTIVGFALCAPLFAFTFWYGKGADKRRFVWEKSLARMRWGAGVGLVAAVAILAVLVSGVLKPV